MKDENSKLITDLDRALSKAKDDQELARRTESDLK